MTDKIIEEALERFKIAEESEEETRRRGKMCDEFSIKLEQWTDAAKLSRGEGNQSTLVLDQTNKFIRSVTNEQRMNRPQIKISPTDDQTQETAEILEGIVRHIQVDSNADVAFDTACDSQVRKGFGYFRLLTTFVDEKSFEQEIKIVPVRNSYSIYLDPDCSDPEYPYPKWAFVTVDIPEERYKKLYPKSELATLGIEGMGDPVPEWLDKGSKSVRVAEYWTVDEAPVTLYQLTTGEIVSEVPEGAMVAKNKLGKDITRESKTYSVMQRKINGVEVLEESEWAGKYIPIIPVWGDDHDLNGKRVLDGMVWPMMDEQRQFNYWSSAATDAIALAPKAPFIMALGQQEGVEHFWNNANVKNYPYMLYKPTTVKDQLAPPPQRNQAEPPIQAMLAMVGQAGQNMKSTLGIFDANLGAKSNETSGRAIMARQKEGDVATFHFIDNLSRALRTLGVFLLDLIPKIYDTARIMRIVHEDGTHEHVKVNQPFDDKGQDGNPVQKIYDLTTGKYDVVVSTGPSYQTKRMEAAEGIQNMIQSFPQLMQVAGDILVKNLDWPGASDVAERLKKMLPPNLQDEAAQIPPEVKAQLDQAHMMIDQLTKALNEAKDKEDAKTLDLSSRERIAEQNNETKLTIAQLQAEMTNNFALFQSELDHLRGTKDHVHSHQQANTPPPVDPNAPPPAAQPDQPPAAL